MSSPKILVVPTGTANIASVEAALRRAGARPRLCSEPHLIEKAQHVVLPGVGAFGAALERIDELELRGALRRRIEAGRATLCICLGMQLLCDTSEESAAARGLGLIPARVRRTPRGLRSPQMGWNLIQPTANGGLLEEGYAYFANSFRLEELPRHWQGARTDYGGDFISALELGAVLACQFHPELSGAFGRDLIARWIKRGLSA